MPRTTTLLSIDGGGIRGVVPALLLAEIEERTGRPSAELFDLIAGTSTGGILALGLSVPDLAGRPKYSARDLVSLYEQEGETIFSRDVRHRIASLGGLTDERYPSAPVEGVLKNYFGEARLQEALTNVVVTSYDIERREPYLFKSFKARQEPAKRDCFMWQAARATSAAPTYFEPFKLETVDRLEYRVLVDGGVFANNPALCAYAEAQNLTRCAPDEQYFVVSLGTGQLTRRLRYENAKSWGLIGWARPVLDIVFDGVSDAVDYQMRKLLEEFRDPTQYYRFQGELTKANDDMDDASERNIRDLRLLAESMLEAYHRDIKELCDRLVQVRDARVRTAPAPAGPAKAAVATSLA